MSDFKIPDSTFLLSWTSTGALRPEGGIGKSLRDFPAPALIGCSSFQLLHLTFKRLSFVQKGRSRGPFAPKKALES